MTLVERIVLYIFLTYIFILVGVFTSSQAFGRTREPKYKIIVMDTGYNPQVIKPYVKVCETGHFDFIKQTPTLTPVTSEEHGTLVANIIGKELPNVDYCILFYRLYEPRPTTEQVEQRTIQAFEMAREARATAINYSLEGAYHSFADRRVLEACAKKVQVFVAAGNSNVNLDQMCISYPACYKHIPGMTVVGSQTESEPRQKSLYSNFGSIIDVWESGVYYDRATQTYEEGTSFATPRALGKWLKDLSSLSQ